MGASDRISKYLPYKINIRTVEGYFLVSLYYDKKWEVLNKNSTITVHTEECKDGKLQVCHYVTQVENGLEIIYDEIDVTIDHNKELEAKAELLREKWEEILKIFSDESYETLKTLEFKYKKKNGKKTKPEIKEEDDINNNPNNDSNNDLNNETNDNVVDEMEMSDIDKKIKEAIKG